MAAIQTTNAPFLSVTRSNNTVVVSWPGPEVGWQLQSTPALLGAATVWTEIPPPYTVSGTNLVFIEDSSVGNKFYRLHRP